MRSLFGSMMSVALTMLLVVGCAEDSEPMMIVPDATPDGPVTPPPPPMMDATPDRMVPPGGDGNDSFEEAVEIGFGSMAGAGGAIGTPRDRDFYTFMGTAGQWLAIDIEANPMDDPMKVDTVIRLYDSSMMMIAENDDAVPRRNTDSELITRLPSAGVFYVEVLEFSDWADDEPEGDPSYTYELSIIEVDPRAEAVTLEEEAGDDDTAAQPLSSNSGFILGTFEDSTDTDVFSLTIPAGMNVNFGAQIMPNGPTGYGSTSTAGVIEVAQAGSSDVVTRIDNSTGQDDTSPHLAPGDYLIRISHPGGRIGMNDFYVFKINAGNDNPAETAEMENNTVMGAEPVSVMPSGTRRSGFVLATLGTDDDVDHFSLGPAPGEVLSVACGSESHGTGVRGLNVAVLGGDGTTVLNMATETPAEGIFMRDVAIPAMTDTIYIRIQKTSQAAGILDNTVRCGFHFGEPRM